MDRNKLKVIKGGSDFSAENAPKKFISAFVTNTRLMGVLVIYVHWSLEKDGRQRSLHQFFYVETTEVGVESYSSMYGNDPKTLLEIEAAMTGGLGGEKVGITEKEVYMLLQAYAKMTEDFDQNLPKGIEEYGFILNEAIKYSQAEQQALFKKTCVPITSVEQLINYFLIRYIASDFDAADYLCRKPLPRDIIPNSGSRILCVNKIEDHIDMNRNKSFMCESLIEDQTNYRIVVTEIRVSGKLIGSFSKISDFPISSAEAAMKLARPEFITVYEIMEGRDEVNKVLKKMFPAALNKTTDMGRVRLMFKNNNDHVKEALYRLNDDIKGIVYITDEDQLILASYSLSQIHKYEKELQFSTFGNHIIALAKYEFKESIFYDFMQSDTGDFLHYIEYVSDYDPDD